MLAAARRKASEAGVAVEFLQQDMRCFSIPEHFDKFQHTLVGPIKAARVAVGIGVVLRKGFELADVDFTNQR